MEFDENKAVEFINSRLASVGRPAVDGDEILNIIDMIWDYYEENGLLEVDVDDEDEDDFATVDELLDYVTRMVKKDRDAKVELADLRTIIEAELDYEASLED